MLEATLQYQYGQCKAQPFPRSANQDPSAIRTTQELTQEVPARKFRWLSRPFMLYWGGKNKFILDFPLSLNSFYIVVAYSAHILLTGRSGSSFQSAELAGKDADYDMSLAILQMSSHGIFDESLSAHDYASDQGAPFDNTTNTGIMGEQPKLLEHTIAYNDTTTQLPLPLHSLPGFGAAFAFMCFLPVFNRVPGNQGRCHVKFMWNCTFCFGSNRWTIFLETTQEQQVIWLDKPPRL
ncbi:Rab-GTPase-TBC domain-containing protein [Artemisia annua]|uniref:Rab-GTPase-TBC domain-containing protein n=1 Tax=Artemisia annua TaxID=35608 RepID=A0A2U1N8N0_ARTAN|nr:Rab-GTPase-TBC domain-containing protein [Artemisia annua]